MTAVAAVNARKRAEEEEEEEEAHQQDEQRSKHHQKTPAMRNTTFQAVKSLCSGFCSNISLIAIPWRGDAGAAARAHTRFAQSIFHHFHCNELAGKKLLIADYRLDCTSDTYLAFMPVVLIVLFGFVARSFPGTYSATKRSSTRAGCIKRSDGCTSRTVCSWRRILGSKRRHHEDDFDRALDL